MAAVDFFSAFQYKWAQTGNVFAWDDAQYKLGWATIGSTPPSVEQFNRAQQVLDEKANWLYGQLATVAADKGVTLSSASFTGLQQVLAAYTPNATETNIGVIRIATTSEAVGLTNDTAALTSKKLSDAFKGSNQNLSVSGFQKLPGGLIRQWGRVAVSLVSGTEVSNAVVFPFAFPNACFTVLTDIATLTPGAVSSSPGSTPTTSGFTLYSYTQITSGDTTAFWMAEGN